LLPKYNKKKLPKDWNLYKTQRNLTVSIIRKEKASYYVKLSPMLSNPKISAKKWWGVVKSIYGTKVCSTIPPLKENYIYVCDPNEKAKLFNDYFVSQATQHSYILSAHTRESFRTIANGVL
jgi:NAD(P)H-flavin reductase